MTSERSGDVPKGRYRVVGPSFDDLLRRSQVQDRLFPEVADWRRTEHRRIGLEAATNDEVIDMVHASFEAEIKLFPEYWNRIYDIARDSSRDHFEGLYRTHYLCLFGIMKPLEFKSVDHVTHVDWDRSFNHTT